MAAIEIQKLCKQFGKTKVLADYSLQVPAGTMLTLLGPSGSGKSTLLRVIAGLEKIDTGRVLIGETLANNGPAILLTPMQRKVAMVFQDLALWPHLTVERHLLLALKARKLSRASRKEIIEELLQEMGIAAHRKKCPGSMSGGEQQRLALARALCVNPELLLLDEPLSHLDTELKQEMLDLLRRVISERKMTTVWVTHDPNETQDFETQILKLTAKNK